MSTFKAGQQVSHPSRNGYGNTGTVSKVDSDGRVHVTWLKYVPTEPKDHVVIRQNRLRVSYDPVDAAKFLS
jgi:hypothetical protein